MGQVLLMVNSYDGCAGERLEGKKQFLKTSYSAPLVRGHGARLVGDKTFQKRHFQKYHGTKQRYHGTSSHFFLGFFFSNTLEVHNYSVERNLKHLSALFSPRSSGLLLIRKIY